MKGLKAFSGMLKPSKHLYHFCCSRHFACLHKTTTLLGRDRELLCKCYVQSQFYHKQQVALFSTLGRMRNDWSRKKEWEIWPEKYLLSQLWLFCVPVKVFSTLSQTIICDVSRDIDRKKLWKSKHLQNSARCDTVSFQRLLDELLEQKCKTFIGQLDDVLQRRLKIIQLEQSFLFSEGYAVPSPESMSHKRWLEAMTFSTMDERLEYYLSLEADKGYEENVQDFNGQFTSDRTEGSARKDHISNAALSVPVKEPNNSINHSDEQLCDERLQSAMQGGIPLMIDMDYVGHMSCQELDACGEQLWLAYCNNRQHINPFHLVLSGCKPDNASHRYMELLHQGNKPHFFATVTEKSPVDLRPASELVYLSSKAKEVLTVFDPNKVYILGAYSNKKTIKHPCIMKASKQNIRAMRLPIDEHVRWPGGPKNLLLQDILKVLLAVKDGASWKEALKPIILHGASIPHWIREAKKKDKLPSKTQPQPVKKNKNKV